MKAVINLIFGLALLGVLSMPVYSMHNQKHVDPSWPAWLQAQKPIASGQMTFTENLNMIYNIYLDSNDLGRKVACFEHSWWQLRSMWNLELNRPAIELAEQDLLLMQELTRRISVFSDNLSKFISGNNLHNNEQVKFMVKSLLLEIGASSCSTDKMVYYAVERLSAYRKFDSGPTTPRKTQAMEDSLMAAKMTILEIEQMLPSLWQ